MSSFSDQHSPYRRPRPHFTADPKEIRPAVDRRQLLMGSALLMGLALLMILAMIPLRTSDSSEPGAELASLDAAQALQADCAVIQQMTYTPCGHSVTRRQTLPAELAGKQRSDLERAYDAWQVTAFSPAEVTMARSLDMHCPQHVVLMPNESGLLCIWQNRYGDALALVKELGAAVGEMPDDVQDELRRGKGFDTQEALEKWLESVES